MKGDFSRESFDATRRYTSVRMQQGRVQLDADWNEQADIVSHRAEMDTADVVGRCGAPLHDAGFGVALDDDALGVGNFWIGIGRYYVDGILLENAEDSAYAGQRDLPGIDPLDPSTKGFYVVYLDVWHRHITALEDERLREVALGGPDTATRSKTVWQVRAVYAGEGALDCLSRPQQYLDVTAPPTGRLRARAKREEFSTDPCLVPASAGYRGLGNQLYRVELHDRGGTFDVGSGSGHTAITEFISETELRYTGGEWEVGDAVEIYLAAESADRMAGYLAYVTAKGSGNTLTLNVALPALSLDDLPRLRRVHGDPLPAHATYKWSRDNGTVVSPVKTITGRDVVVHSLGPDDVATFRPGDWVELLDDERELVGLPGYLGQVESVLADRTIRLRAAPTPYPGDVPGEDPSRHLKLRRWDGAGVVKAHPPEGHEAYVELEDGIQLRFEDGTFHTGDYWLIPARTATADARSGQIDWPSDPDSPEPRALSPRGIEHHYCSVAVLESNGSKFSLTSDCRSFFPPTTELAALVYVGGDGQETLPGGVLAQPLETGVFQGRWPVEGARVRFTADDGGGLGPTAEHASSPHAPATLEVATDGDGIATCYWRPASDTTRPSQRTRAQLLDAADDPLPPLVDFNATLSLAERVGYTPNCTDLAGAETVQEALDLLCLRGGGGGAGCTVTVLPEQRLDEVIGALLEAGVRELCLCLARGVHEVPEGLNITGADIVLRMTGCGSGSQLVLGRPVRVRAARELTFHSLDVVCSEQAGIGAVGCRDVTFEGCAFRRREPGEDLLAISGAQRVRIANNVLDGHFGPGGHVVRAIVELLTQEDRRAAAARAAALGAELARDERARAALAQEIDRAKVEIGNLWEAEQRAYLVLRDMLAAASYADAFAGALLLVHDAGARAGATPVLSITDGNAEVVIADNEILGAVTLYGPGFDGVFGRNDLSWIQERREGGSDFQLVPGAGTLHVRDNRLTRLGLDEDTMNAAIEGGRGGPFLRMFRAIHVVNNIFAQGEIPTYLFAPRVGLTSNYFDVRWSELGAVLADSAVYTGNYAPSPEFGPPPPRRPVQLFDLADRSAREANLDIDIVDHV